MSRAITPKTPCCAVMGDPVGHSLSPAIHNRAFAVLSMDWIYLAHRVVDVRGALDGIRALGGYRGISITIPHKEAAISCVDEVDELAQAIGAINTVTRDDSGRLSGTNTDGIGALRALRCSSVDPTGRRALILGSGGAARGIAITLARETPPTQLDVEARNPSTASALVSDISSYVPSRLLKPKDDKKNYDIIIQTTSVGLYPDVEESLWPPEAFHSKSLIMDIIYNPLETEFLRRARVAGCPVIDGLSMFIHQAAAQFELWTSRPAPVDAMREEALTVLQGTSP